MESDGKSGEQVRHGTGWCVEAENRDAEKFAACLMDIFYLLCPFLENIGDTENVLNSFGAKFEQTAECKKLKRIRKKSKDVARNNEFLEREFGSGKKRLDRLQILKEKLSLCCKIQKLRRKKFGELCKCLTLDDLKLTDQMNCLPLALKRTQPWKETFLRSWEEFVGKRRRGLFDPSSGGRKDAEGT